MNHPINGSIKKYYTIGEVSALLGVSTSLLRFWEQKFPHLKPLRSEKGIRSYTAAHITYLRKIHRFVKEEGYTLQGAKAAMRQKLPDEPGVEAMIKRLKSLKESLLALKNNEPFK